MFPRPCRYARSWHDSVVDDIFSGQLQSTIECSVCKHQSHCFDPFWDLNVPIPPKAKLISTSTSLLSCLNTFVEADRLDGAEKYKCEVCRKEQAATKRMQVYRYPRVLVLTLKRFASSSSAYGR